MLNSGEVPNLFEKDELEQVLAATRPKAKEAGVSEENRDEVRTDTLDIENASFRCSTVYNYNMCWETDGVSCTKILGVCACVAGFQVFQYFISCVRAKLHIVLCMSPVGDAFRSRCRMFPSLVNCCTIDWFVQVC